MRGDGHALGTLCVIDRQPRELRPDQQEALRALSRQVVAQLELRRSVAELARRADELLGRQRELQQYQLALEHANALLEKESATDALTGLGNRRAFEERLEDELVRAGRYGLPLSLVLLDLDQFKAYNDTFGHPAGDDVLRGLAEILRRNCRAADFPARHGGEARPRQGVAVHIGTAERSSP